MNSPKKNDYYKCHCAMSYCPCNRRFKELEKEIERLRGELLGHLIVDDIKQQGLKND